MKVVILAAGTGSRLRPYTGDVPKSLLKIAGKEIISYQIDALIEEGIDELVIVIGYRGDKIKEFIKSYPKAKELHITYIKNKEYNSSNSSYSLWLARNELTGGYIHLNGDLIFHPTLLKKLVESKHSNSIIIDRVVELGNDMVKVNLDGNRIIEMSRDRNSKSYSGEAVGPAIFSEDGAKKIISIIDTLINKGIKNRAFYFVLDDFVKQSLLFGINSENLPWFEIDTYADLKKAEEELKKNKFFT